MHQFIIHHRSAAARHTATHGRSPTRTDDEVSPFANMPPSSTNLNPFARADAWRAHPLLNKPWGHAFPGLALGAGMFAVYYASEKVRARKGKGNGDGAH